MNSEKRTILALIASGRITAAEAERLLRLGNEAREELCIVAACLLICAAQLHMRVSFDGISHMVQQTTSAVLSVWNVAAHTVARAATAVLSKGMGGTI